MAEETILESTDRTSGREALRKNVQAAIALAGAVRSTLGPKGLDKLLIDDEGRTLVTNDGVTVLETAKVEHPVARMIINASSTQDRVARDGTTSTVVICAEVLRNAWQLVRQGIHPATIARGFAQSEAFALKLLDEMTIDANPEQMFSAIETSLSGKMERRTQARLSKLAFEASEKISTEKRTDPTRVKIIHQTGGSAIDTELVTGLAIPKTRVHSEMLEHGGPGSILLVDGGLEKRSPLLDAKLSITSTGMLDAFRAAEVKAVMKQIENLKSIGCDILVVKEGIDDEARQALADAGILAYRRVESKDLELLARACNTSLIHDIGRATKEDLGAFISTREKLKGGTNYWILSSEDDAATLIARGSSTEVLGEVERCFGDALGVACQLQEDPKLLPGGGATQVALARAIRLHAETIPGREQMAMEAWADGLEVIPRALAQNAGLDPIESLLKLTAAQSEGGVMVGLNLETGIPSDTISRGVLEPVKITRQAISGATEAAISILRIDDVLWAQMDAQVPDDIQQQLAGMGPE